MFLLDGGVGGDCNGLLCFLFFFWSPGEGSRHTLTLSSDPPHSRCYTGQKLIVSYGTTPESLIYIFSYNRYNRILLKKGR